jgi:hypothetical protein
VCVCVCVCEGVCVFVCVWRSVEEEEEVVVCVCVCVCVCDSMHVSFLCPCFVVASLMFLDYRSLYRHCAVRSQTIALFSGHLTLHLILTVSADTTSLLSRRDHGCVLVGDIGERGHANEADLVLPVR